MVDTPLSSYPVRTLSYLLGHDAGNLVGKAAVASVGVSQSYVDTADALRLLKAGDTVTGALGVGFAPTAGVNLSVTKQLTGAVNAYGVYSAGQVLSDVTGIASYFRSVGNTAAAAFTVSSVNHYWATQATFGAGSAVTQQIGFYADAGLIGAASNYGYFGNIPAAANRWNVYMNGNARNYMAGALSIGAQNDPGAGGLYVSGSLVCAKPVVLPSYTVATLPAAATVGAGAVAFVTDANATTFNSVVAGGGTNKITVFSDGTSWHIG